MSPACRASAMMAAKAAEGNQLFHSETAACYYCHGADAKGKQAIGAPNLTDKIWLWANVPGAAIAMRPRSQRFAGDHTAA